MLIVYYFSTFSTTTMFIYIYLVNSTQKRKKTLTSGSDLRIIIKMEVKKMEKKHSHTLNEITHLTQVLVNLKVCQDKLGETLELIDDMIKKEKNTENRKMLKTCRNITENELFDVENILIAIQSAATQKQRRGAK